MSTSAKRHHEEARGEARFLPLLGTLILLFALYPLAIHTRWDHLYGISFFVVLVTAVYSLGDRKRHLKVAIALAVPAALGQMATLLQGGGYPLKITANLLALVFLVYVIGVVLGAVLREGEVTGDKIAGAICGYLLLGLGFALAYNVADLLQPGAFGDVDLSGESGDEFGFLYFSFVTLTALGYGDITPVSVLVRTMAWMQAVTGQLYVAILVARLVALQIAHSMARKESAEG
jgi:hypothetical protein